MPTDIPPGDLAAAKDFVLRTARLLERHRFAFLFGIIWEPPSGAAAEEWRGITTIKQLAVLDSYGALGSNCLSFHTTRGALDGRINGNLSSAKAGGSYQCGGSSPTSPSTDSRIRSA